MVEFQGHSRLFDRGVTISVHADVQMRERSIDRKDVLTVADSGEIIEIYPNDTAYPSELILGWVDSKPIHVVLAYSVNGDRVAVLTAYEPDSDRWHTDWKRRRR